MVPRFYHDAKTHVAGLFANDLARTNEPAGDELDPTPSDGILHLPVREGRTEGSTQPEPAPRWKLLEERRLDPHRPAVGSYRRTTDFRVSPTDSDATPMWDRGATTLGYHDHYVVDGGKQRIILAALVTPADVMENVPLRDLLWRVCFRRKLRPHHVTGDTTYGTIENIVAIEDAGIRAYLPLPDFGHRTPFFGRDAFIYDLDADAYRCPAGQTLRFRTHKHTERERVYQASAGTCNACPLKARCTLSAKGRQLTRSFDEAYLDRVRGYHATEPYKKAIRKRQVWVEPLFAEAKEWHGLRRLRLRGLMNANIQGLLIAAGQNLKRFLATRGWGRRNAPCGSLVALPRDPWRLSAFAG